MNNNVHVFQDKDKKFTLSVKKDFLDVCPNPETHTIFELNSEYNMFNFLHNEVEPAVIRHKDNVQQFWMDGFFLEKQNPELNEKMKNNYNFNKKLDGLLTSDEA